MISIQPFFWSISCYVWSIVIILYPIEKNRKEIFRKKGSIIIFFSSNPKSIFIPCCFWKCWRFWCIDYIHHDVDWQFLKKMKFILSWNWPLSTSSELYILVPTIFFILFHKPTVFKTTILKNRTKKSSSNKSGLLS